MNCAPPIISTTMATATAQGGGGRGPPPLLHAIVNNEKLMRDIRSEFSEVLTLSALADKRRAFDLSTAGVAVSVRPLSDAPDAPASILSMIEQGEEPVAALHALVVSVPPNESGGHSC